MADTRPTASIEAVESGLAAQGYIASRQIATAVYLSQQIEKPILVEGPAGVGKTELAKAIAAWRGMKMIRLQCYEGLDEAKALYEWKYAKQLLYTQILKDKLGEQLFSKDIRIIDDPLRVRGLRSQTFDAEGVKVKKIALIDEGVLTTWVLDSATARELGLVTTGHAHRGVSSSPSPGTYNLHLEPGAVTPKQLISDIKQGFYVTDLIGSGVNGVTGDYSRGASGFWIENGEITYPVSEVTIAGHLLPMFKSLVAANDLEFRYGVNSPTLRIEGLTLGGR